MEMVNGVNTGFGMTDILTGANHAGADHHCSTGGDHASSNYHDVSGGMSDNAFDPGLVSPGSQETGSDGGDASSFEEILNLLDQAATAETDEERGDLLDDAIEALEELLLDGSLGSEDAGTHQGGGDSDGSTSAIDTLNASNGRAISDAYHGHEEDSGGHHAGSTDNHQHGDHQTQGDASGGGGSVHGDHGDHGDHGSVDETHGGHGTRPTTTTASDTAPDWILEGLGDQVEADGTLKPFHQDGLGHQHGMGEELNVHEIFDTAGAMGIDAEAFIQDFMADSSNFNDSRHLEESMLKGSLAVLNDTMAAVSMGGLEGDPNDLELTAGAATNAAFNGDADTLREILTDAGGDVSGLDDDQLLNMWGGNSHYYNHAVLDGDGFELTHLRSLNDNAMDGTDPGTRGGYNDKGEYRQRTNSEFEFFDNSRDFLDSVSHLLPSTSGGGGAEDASYVAPSYESAGDHAHHGHG